MEDYANVGVDLSIRSGRVVTRGLSVDSSRLPEEPGIEAQYDLAEGVREYALWLNDQR